MSKIIYDCWIIMDLPFVVTLNHMNEYFLIIPIIVVRS
jgi:hypothetical protein